MGVEEASTGPGHPPMNPALSTPLLVLGGVLIVLFLCRSFVRLRHRRRLREILKKDDQCKFAKSNPLNATLKKHVLYAPLGSVRHNREFRLMGRVHMGTIPLRMEIVLLLGYLALNIAFFFVLIDWPTDFQEKMYQFKYAAGHLAVMNSPALVLTAGRNNPLIPLLGIPFDTFNLLHRWIGRLMAVEGVIHMSCVLAGKARLEGWNEFALYMWHIPFFQYGFVALIGFVVIFFQASSPLRHAFYEFFLHLHILLAVMAFVGLWYHLKGLTQQRVLLVTLILWGLDRAVRLLTLLWRNCGKRCTTATVELLPGAVARVDIAVARAWTFKPGQFLYLYMPSLGLWTSHPFSVAWTSSEREVDEKHDSSDSFNTLLETPRRTTMSFLIKGRDGFTNTLLNRVQKSENGKFSVTALAEGPFGGIHSLDSYGTVLLVAGGIGITHPMSYLHQFVSGFSARTIATRKVSLIWVVRSIDHLTWIQSWMSSILSHPSLQSSSENKHHSYFQFPDFSLSIQIYLTNTEYSNDEYITAESPWAHTAPPSVPVSINWGKPRLGQILESEKAQQIGAMAVSVCGPGGLGDDVRKVVRESQGEKTVDLYEESFSW